MKKIIFIFLIFNFHFLISNAQSQFQKIIGGTNDDYARSIIQTTDGGYAIAGCTYSFGAGDADFYIVKLNSSGTLQWNRTVGRTGEDIALSIIQTTDGGYAVAGYTRPFGEPTADFYIVKLNSSSALQWSRTIDKANYDFAFSIVQTSDGGFVAAGFTATGGVFTDDMYIVKLDSEGTYQWSKTYGGSEDDLIFSIIKTTDGGFVAAGYTDSFNLWDNYVYILKLDGNGNLQWYRTIGGTTTGSEAAYSIIQTTDGGFVLAGEAESFGAGTYDMYIIKIDSIGTVQWTKTLGGISQDWAYSIVQTSDGGFVASGYTTSFGVSDFYAVKLNSSGTLLWSKTYGGSGTETAYSLTKTSDGGMVIAGETSSFGAGGKDIFIVKIDSLGNTCGNTTTPATISGTGGILGSPVPNVTTANPTVTSPTPTVSTGGILNTICTITPPAPPILVSPPNGSYNEPSTIRFIWNKPLYAVSYRIQVALDSQFTSLVVNDSSLTDSTIIVTNLHANRYYWWRVNAKNSYGTSQYSDVWKFGTFPVGVKEIKKNTPNKFMLYQNFPNPFNPVSKIKFDIAKMGNVKLIIYDMLGREVSVLVNEYLLTGTYETEFDASNFPSGIYLYKLETETFTETRKMVLIK